MNRRVWAAVVAVLALLAPIALSDFAISLLNYVGLASFVALGLVLLTGVAGITSFGQAAFVGIGAYLTAWLTTRYAISPWITLPLTLVATGGAAALLGWLTLGLEGHYLPLSTMAWGLSLYFLFGNVDALGGQTGIDHIAELTVGTWTFDTQRRFYYVIWPVLLVMLLLVHNLLDSRQGRSLRALRRGKLMIQSFGVDTAHVKNVAFTYAAVLAALSGWMYAHLLRFVNPSPFGLNAGIEYLFMAVVGGAANVLGAIAGAAVITLLRQVLREWLPTLLGQQANYEMIVFGVLMILLLQRSRGGLASLMARWPSRPNPVGNRVPVAPVALTARSQPTPGEALLEVESARKTFGGLVAVDDVSFELRSGEILGLIGPNGAGKSTTFNLITGVTSMTSGVVRFAGRQMSGRPLKEVVRCGIARTFQHVNLIPDMSALENVALGAYARTRTGVFAASFRTNRLEEASVMAEAARQLERVGLRDRLHERAGDLPLGQQRVLEIARALAADPILLLLDEPAAGLRFKEKKTLLDLLRKLRDEGMSILIVEHDMDLVMRLVDRLIVMDAGRKLFEGAPAEVQKSSLVREAYLGAV